MKPEEITALKYVLENFEPKWETHDMSCWNVIRRMIEGQEEDKTEEHKYEKDTVGYWLEQIEDKEIREKALANLWPTSADSPARSIFHAIGKAFLWSESPEGHDFWSKINGEYFKKEG